MKREETHHTGNEVSDVDSVLFIFIVLMIMLLVFFVLRIVNMGVQSR